MLKKYTLYVVLLILNNEKMSFKANTKVFQTSQNYGSVAFDMSFVIFVLI